MIQWTSLSHEALHFENYFPQGFTGIRMPDADVATAKGSFGHLTFQTIENPDFCFQYSVHDLERPITLMARSKWAGLYARIMLESHILHKVKNADNLYLREGQFSLALANAIEAKLEYTGARAYMSFDVCFSMQMVRRMLFFYPQASHLFNIDISKRPVLLIPFPRAAGQHTEALVESLLREPRSQDQADLLLKNLLGHLVAGESEQLPGRHVVDNIYAVEQMIADDIRKNYLVEELARRANTNVNYFKRYFRWIFGTSPHQYIIRLRMRKAKRLLKSGQSVKVTALAAGYKSTAEFTKAFKNFWGVSPENIRNEE